MEYLSHSTEETEALGEALAARLRPGDVVAYRGGLGVGKTAFTRGLARGLGCAGRVSSPTFTLVNEHEGRLPLFHFDLYRPGWRVRSRVERAGSRRAAGGDHTGCSGAL